MEQKSLRTQVNYSKIGIDKNQLSVNSRENSRTFPKIRGTALVTLNKVGGNPVSYNIPQIPRFSMENDGKTLHGIPSQIHNLTPQFHCK